jgi:enoyl-CoA hydratase/carnithine racemase
MGSKRRTREGEAMTDSDTLVSYEVIDGVAKLTLTNPPVNGYSYAMMRALDAWILEARMDDDVHVLLITGSGEKFFCAGADITILQQLAPNEKAAFCLHANETLLRLEHTPKLVIAALGGHTVGGGLEIALACDLRIGRRGSGKVGLPEVHLGVLPGTGGTQRLARALGKSKAIELMVEGGNMDFEGALELGLVNKLFDAESEDDFVAQCLDYARSFCPPQRASGAVGLIKRAVQTGAETSLEVGLALERELQNRLFVASDAKEGLAAYNEKRKPNFTGI